MDRLAKRRGVTLIELLVVLALIGLAMSVVTPMLTRGLDTIVLRTTGNRLIASFKQARNVARAKQQVITGVYANNQFTFSQRGKTLKMLELPDSIQVQDTDSVYMFFPSGQIVGPDKFELVNARGRRGILEMDTPAGNFKFTELRQ